MLNMSGRYKHKTRLFIRLLSKLQSLFYRCGSSDRKDMGNRMQARAQAEARDFSFELASRTAVSRIILKTAVGDANLT